MCIGETGKSVQERIKNMTETYGLLVLRPLRFRSTLTKRDIFLLRSKFKLIYRYPHWYTSRVKEAIHIRLHPNKINRDSGINIPEAWIPTIKQHNSRFIRTYEGTPYNNQNDNEDRNAPITEYQRATNSEQSSSPIEILLFSLTYPLHHLSGRSTLGMSLIHDWKFRRLLFPLRLGNSSAAEWLEK